MRDLEVGNSEQMPKKTMHFMGILANVDSSILEMRFDHGFQVKAVSRNRGERLISALEQVPDDVVVEKLFHLACWNMSKDKLYFISKGFESEIQVTGKGRLGGFPSILPEFNKKFVEGYLNPCIRLMRLFKEGNISMPAMYYYYMDKGIPRSFIRSWSGASLVPETYTLQSSEVPKLREFIQDTKLPFSKSFVQLAFDNFELSYQIPNVNLSFLSLMMSLETLFNPGRHEVTHRLSRNTAVLLGKKESDSRNLFLEVKNLYGKRCDIVHEGRPNIVSRQDLLRLRYLVRESIKKVSRVDKSKDELMDLLNSCGFGERPWRK